MSSIYYRIRADVIVTSKNVNMEQQIIDEISIFCSKLERLVGTTHVYLSRQDVIAEPERPEPRTGKGSLD